ncbi:unnamed protein product [Vitrella brassicaformis CCMP3155]|uniref:Uncharacterized protein n=2 Tax=Vitrella brassicaformis TaxID=1169539 RepID=A0A0G4E9E8_VITBC|nr:unnamed protein product [Vitrella brassicaformis CCMP3155]|eukprot:CEL91854.1 unnamed protein product [Vitrella brassicaformis CCMP3155]
MQPTSAMACSEPTAAHPAVPSLLGMTISKASRMAASDDADTRAALGARIGALSQAERSTVLGLVQGRIEEAMTRLQLHDVVDSDTDSLEGALKAVFVLEQGGEEWRVMGRFIRMAANYRLTPNAALPLHLPAASLPTAAAFRKLPRAMAVYTAFGNRLTHTGTRLGLQAANGSYRIGTQSFHVVPHGDLPHGHRYAGGYKEADPAIRQGNDLFPAFSAFLHETLLFGWCRQAGARQRIAVDYVPVGDADRSRRLGPLKTEHIDEDTAIAVDSCIGGGDLTAAADGRQNRLVIVSGFRPGETAAAHVWLRPNIMTELYTTETPVGGRSQPLDDLPKSMPAFRRLLRRFGGLEDDLIDNLSHGRVRLDG